MKSPSVQYIVLCVPLAKLGHIFCMGHNLTFTFVSLTNVHLHTCTSVVYSDLLLASCSCVSVQVEAGKAELEKLQKANQSRHSEIKEVRPYNSSVTTHRC